MKRVLIATQTALFLTCFQTTFAEDCLDYAQNQPPILDSIGPQSTNEAVTLAFGISATDPDGTIPELFASPLPSGALFTDSSNGNASFVWTPTFTQAGTYGVTFYADDGEVYDSEYVTITVFEVGNQAHVLDSIGPKTVEALNLLQFAVTGWDPDGVPPALRVPDLPGTASFLDNGDGTGCFDWTPQSSDVGVHYVLFEAFDHQLADSEWVPITVHDTAGCCLKRGNVNHDPQLSTDISDLVYLVDYMFTGGPEPPCMEEANVNALDDVDISDLVYLVDYMFTGGPEPPAC